MSDNYYMDKKLVGGMINSIGIAHQDLIAIKYIFENMEKGLTRVSFEGTLPGIWKIPAYSDWIFLLMRKT